MSPGAFSLGKLCKTSFNLHSVCQSSASPRKWGCSTFNSTLILLPETQAFFGVECEWAHDPLRASSWANCQVRREEQLVIREVKRQNGLLSNIPVHQSSYCYSTFKCESWYCTGSHVETCSQSLARKSWKIKRQKHNHLVSHVWNTTLHLLM